MTTGAWRDLRPADNDRREQLLLVIPAGVLILAGLLLALLTHPLALVVAAVLATALAVLALTAGARMVLAALDTRPADREVFPRYHNLVEGLCLEAGVAVPTLLVIDHPSANALALGASADRATVAVTTGMLERFNLVELEGVLAHQLALIGSHAARTRTVAVILGGLSPALWYRGGAWRVLAWPAAAFLPLQRLLDQPRLEVEADERGALLTRYPPGLIQALGKLAIETEAPRGARACTHLWTVEPPRPVDEPAWLWSRLEHRPVDERVAELRDL